MAYRRRRVSRSTRRPRRRYTWVRQAASVPGWAPDMVWIVDLLWEARQPAGVAGPLESLPSSRAALDSALLPPLDLQDVMIERIRGSLALQWTTGAGTELTSSFTIGITTDSNSNIGVKSNLSTGAYDSISPRRSPAAQSCSWMDYERIYAYGPQFVTGEIGTGNRLAVRYIDVRSRRRLRDWGDNLYFIAEPGGLTGVTAVAAELCTSVLLSHR